MDQGTIKQINKAGNDIDFTTEDFPTHYAQEAVIGTSFFDFSLVFIQNSIKGKTPVTSVTFPPAVAKQIASILQSNIERYEETFGEIKVPSPPQNGMNKSTKYEGGIS